MSSTDLLTHILSELREIRADINGIRATQSEQHGVLREHIRRTAAAEDLLEEHRGRFVPLEAHVNGWAGVGKAITVLSLIGGLAVAVFKFWPG